MVIFRELQSVRFRKRNIFLLVFLFFLICFCKCKPDFSINSDSGDFPVIYGLLDVTDNTHYVKIYKSFVTEGNAYDVVKDITQYSYIDSIEVFLNEYDVNNNFIRKIPMDTSTAIAKDSGLFFYPSQILYVANAVLNRDYLYEIEVFNPQTKDIAKVKRPIAMTGTVNIVRPAGSEIGISDNTLTFEFYTGHNINMYQLLLKLYYTEDFVDGTSQQPYPVVWDLGNMVDKNSGGGTKKLQLLVSSGGAFFQRIANSILENNNVRARHVDSIVLEVHSAGVDWGLYIQSNLPSSGINQDRLHYSNIIAYNTETGDEKYATGVFSSRGITTRKYNHLLLQSGSRDSLFHGRYTRHLKFTDIY